MGRTANIMTRVEPEIKEQAEYVLNQLGISMSTAMTIYLRQIALHNKIPFEMKLPDKNPIAFQSLSEEEFTILMNKSLEDYKLGRVYSPQEVREHLNRDLGL